MNQAEEERVLDSALKSLGRRPHSVYELKIKLLKKGMDEGAVINVLHRLQEDKYLDDVDFAERFLEYGLVRKSWGKMKIRAELQKRGVSREIVDGALESPDVLEREISGAKRFVEKRMSIEKGRGEGLKEGFKEEIIVKLKRRGFGWEVIEEAIRRI
ncbi:MAG: regulatory protein RecX [Deltaproteobacteria bacterium]|uniref:Regulatory protein RecX n=1 Tax=Candidatus Zymogenus saltonus TaxID=2844893 RepID=A0A9D8KFE3_9DELT|nr:regulatory protein RecX [Candidatus Zymogenus saltonus]